MEQDKSIPKSLFIMILISLVIRGIAAYCLQLGNDESYYITYALHPALSHFDHPSMVGLGIQLTTLNLFFTSDFAVRLSAVILGTFSIYLLYLIGRKIKNERTGFIAACLGITSVYLSVICGTFITPDPSLLFFILLSFYFFLNFITSLPEESRNIDVFLAQLFLGLAIYSKYQAVYLGFGILLYVIFVNRKWFKKLSIYVCTLLPLIFIGLIVYWNYNHKFISATFQGDRVIDITKIDILHCWFLVELAGEMGLYNPINVVCILLAVFSFRKKRFMESKYFSLILFCSLPLLATVFFLSLFNQTLPHWVGISYMLLYLIAAAYLDQVLKKLKCIRIYTYIILFGFAVAVIVLKYGLFFPGAYVPKTLDSVYAKPVVNPAPLSSWEENLGGRNYSLDTAEWDQVNKAYKQFIKLLPEYKDYSILSSPWFIASHIDFYVAIPNKKKLYMYGKMCDVHEYYWLNKKRGELKKGDNAIFITTSHAYNNPEGLLKDYFENISLIYRAPVFRRGAIVEFVFIYKLEDFTGKKNG